MATEHYLYALTNTKNGKTYIGETENWLQRRRAHKSSITSKGTINATPVEGTWEDYEFKVVVVGTKEYIQKLEPLAILELNTLFPNGYNQAIGRKIIGEGREKRIKARNEWVPSEESRERYRIAATGQKQSQETRDKRSRSMKGKNTTKGKTKKIGEKKPCLYCGTMCSPSPLTRHHNDNCKKKP